MRRPLRILAVVVFAIGVVLGLYILASPQQPREMGLEDAAEIVPAANTPTLAAESRSNGVLLRWTDMEGVAVDYYDVYRRGPADDGEALWLARRKVKELDVDFHEYLDEDVIAGETYSYYVRLVGVSGDGEAVKARSNTVEVTFRASNGE